MLMKDWLENIFIFIVCYLFYIILFEFFFLNIYA